jgi:hypothetical protein
VSGTRQATTREVRKLAQRRCEQLAEALGKLSEGRDDEETRQALAMAQEAGSQLWALVSADLPTGAATLDALTEVIDQVLRDAFAGGDGRPAIELTRLLTAGLDHLGRTPARSDARRVRAARYRQHHNPPRPGCRRCAAQLRGAVA